MISEIRRVTTALRRDDVIEAYRRGLFPMAYGRIIEWHRPDPRAILPLDACHVSRSLARTIRLGRFELTFDRAFADVMRACAARPHTWISESFHRVYGELHREGLAHSVEVWVDGKLAGGLYGVALGGAFFAESKFHRVRDMSKVAVVSLVDHLRAVGFRLLDVQYLTPHLATFGVIEIRASEYEARLADALAVRTADWSSQTAANGPFGSTKDAL